MLEVDLWDNRQIEKHHPNIEGEHGHGTAKQDQIQQHGDVNVLWIHFVGECGDKRHDAQFHSFEIFLKLSGIHHPNQIERI